MTKYHINNEGKKGVCKAQEEANCPFNRNYHSENSQIAEEKSRVLTELIQELINREFENQKCIFDKLGYGKYFEEIITFIISGLSSLENEDIRKITKSKGHFWCSLFLIVSNVLDAPNIVKELLISEISKMCACFFDVSDEVSMQFVKPIGNILNTAALTALIGLNTEMLSLVCKVFAIVFCPESYQEVLNKNPEHPEIKEASESIIDDAIKTVLGDSGITFFKVIKDN